MMQGTPTNIIVGSHVWIEDSDVAWIDGLVLNVNGQEIEIQASNGKRVVASLSNIYPKDVEAPAGGVDDMTKLSYLHEPAVLQNLSVRYQDNEIYEVSLLPLIHSKNCPIVTMITQWKSTREPHLGN